MMKLKRKRNRLQISFNDEEMDVLDEYSELTGVPKSKVINDFFRGSQMIEVLKNSIEVLKEFKEAEQEYKEAKEEADEELTEIKSEIEQDDFMRTLFGRLSKNTDFEKIIEKLK